MDNEYFKCEAAGVSSHDKKLILLHDLIRAAHEHKNFHKTLKTPEMLLQ